MTKTYCGFVAIIGRPNVGKSTLLNSILKTKISITSKKAQTTRHRILGVKTQDDTQAIYVDTPGIHLDAKKALNKQMNKTARRVIRDVDVVVFMVDSNKWTDDDENILKLFENLEIPVLLAVNKVDQIKSKQALLPVLSHLAEKYPFHEIVPIVAKNGDYVSELEASIKSLLPESAFYFPEDQKTDRSEKFYISEVLREKIMRRSGQEVPYSVAVEIERIEETDKLKKIYALIWVEREGQKRIIIGKSGERLKQISTDARIDLEKFFEKKVYLEVWVKIKEGWSDDIRALRSLGYDE